MPARRFQIAPRLTDWSIATATLIAFGTGIISLVSGRLEDWLIFVLHGVGGFWLLLLLWGKVRRVWPRLIHLRRWDRRTIFGLLTLLIVALALGSGIWWVGGGDVSVASFNLLNWHITLGFVLTAAIVIHMFARAKRLRKRDVTGRRQLLHFGAMLLGSAVLWPTQQFIEQTLHLSGAKERFTGSREMGSYAGNAFPTSSWVADAPRPIDVEKWHLAVGGAVTHAQVFSYDYLIAAGDELEATLDCTGGFFSTQHWQGMSIGKLLEQVVPLRDAQYVRFTSVTSYHWSLPIDEARKALVATHVEGEALSYDHGSPLRLVAPGRRGFEWVKWITSVEVLTAPDPEQVLSIFSSSFIDAGRGK